MTVTGEDIRQRITDLKEASRQALSAYMNAAADYNAVLGAIQDCEHWLDIIEYEEGSEQADAEQEPSISEEEHGHGNNDH